MKEIQFEAGESRNGNYGVNFLISTDGTIYAECRVPEDCSDDYGYTTMRQAIIDEWESHGRDPSELKFWYDGQGDVLAADAAADCDVFVDIDF